MKKSILFFTLLFSSVFIYAQTTYYWIGGNGTASSISFSTSSKWNTSLDGTGTVRAASAATDILIIDGSNVGGTTATTGSVTATTGSTNFAQLILRNNAMLTLVRPSSGTGTITINGDATTGDDLLVNAGCTLVSTVADSVNTTSGNNLLLSATATGRVFGTLTVTGGACRMTASNPVVGGALFFESGSFCNVNTGITYYPFGSSSGVPNAVVFNNGSTLNYLGGNCIFTTSSTFTPIEFKTGSTCKIATSIPSATVTSSNLFSTRRYSNLIIAANQSVIGDAFYNIDNLTIESGASFYLKASGVSPVSGNIINNGTLGSNTGFTSSNLLLKGTTAQSIGGTGTFAPLGAFSVGTGADVTVNANIVINGTSNSLLTGKVNFGTHTITGTGSYQTKAAATVTTAVTIGTAGIQQITLDPAAYNSTTNIAGVYAGLLVTGAGVPANTFIIGSSSTNGTIVLSNPTTANITSITISGNVPLFRTSNANGIDGTVSVTGTLSLSSSTDYIFDAPTINPFSMVTIGTMRDVTFNASATTNRTQSITGTLTINSGVLSIKSTDTIRITTGTDIGGAPFNNSKHIATLNNGTTIGLLRIDAITTAKLFPIGTVVNYLPITLTPAVSSTLTASAFEGITANGSVSGLPLTSAELLPIVNAVWKLGRTTGAGDIGMVLGWQQGLEGTIFTTQTNSRIGVIQNSGTSWGAPFGTGDNTNNNATAVATSIGSFGVGSLPLINAFTFNALPSKIYGDADFNCGAISLNTTQPIIYSSSNTAVATISAAGIIHIVGTGTTDINASQASDGNYLAASVTNSLVVDKASLTIRADDKSRFEGVANPTLTATYTGFVNGESSSVLLTAVSLSTTAVIASLPGGYPITATGATAANYNIAYIDGTLTVLAKQNQTITFNTLPVTTYGDANFTTGVFSSNNSIPVVLTSSNNSIATVIGGNIIQITGAGTATITASQAGSDAYFPAADVSLTITVNKAPLVIGVNDAEKAEGDVNPNFTITYSGFVLGETESVLTTQPMVMTTATTNSSPGTYALELSGGTSDNYNFSYTSGRLTIYPKDRNLETLTAYNNNGQVIIKIYSPLPDLGDVVVYNLQGQFLGSKNIFVTPGFTSAQIGFKNIASGYYVVCFRGKKGMISKMISILK